jgi:hypothetical protein
MYCCLYCCLQIRRQEAIDKGQAQRRVYVEKPDMRSKKLARKAGETAAVHGDCSVALHKCWPDLPFPSRARALHSAYCNLHLVGRAVS